MKRKLLISLLSTVAFLFFWQAGFSQNLLANGDMESWTDTTTPTGWTTAESITQDSTIVHGGTYSAKQIGGTKHLGQSIDVTPGDTYNISIWYYVESGDGTHARIWSYWKDGSGGSIYDNAAELRPSTYFNTDASWHNYTVTVTAPANTATLHFELRTYSGATVYWDDLSVQKAAGDVTPPTWTTGYPQAVRVEDTRGTFQVNLDEPGKVYFIVVPSGAAAPTAAQVKAGANYGSVTLLDHDTIEVKQANTTNAFNFTGAQPNTSADVWFVAEDNAGNLQSAPEKISVTTTAARSLSFDNPKANDSYNIGDTIKLEWTSSNIDSLIVTIRPTSSFINVVMADGPFAAAAGSHNIIIPKQAMPGDYSLVLHDYYDTTFKQSVSPVTVVDNRTLQMTKPKDNDTVYVGDTLTFKWTSNNIDSVLIGGYISGDNGPSGNYFMLTGDLDHFDTATFRPIAAASGVWQMYLDPKNMGGSIKLDSVFIWDAADMRFKDYASPVYVLDTFPMRITYSMPAFGMNDFMPGGGINAGFNCDSIIPGTGQLHILKADGTTVEDVDVSQVDFHGDGFSYMPPQQLIPGQSYYITIDSGFVKCADGSQTYSGLMDKSWNFTVTSSSLYFSEYIEGSGNNKALEIYNPTDHNISLDDYIIAGSYNGSGIDDDKPVYHFPKGYVLKAGDVFVVANSQADPAILAHTNDTVAYNEGGFVCGFTGDDARVLIKQVSHDQIWIDAIGNPWEDPGSGWEVAGVPNATKDHTLLRKRNVMMGTDGNWGMSAGSDADHSQWIVKDKDYFGNIGFPTPTGSSQAEILSVMLMNKNKEDVTVSTRILPDKDSVYVTVLSGTDVTQMYGKFEVSQGAEIQPDSTKLLDFTHPLQFTVYAENGVDSTVWTVAVTVASAPSSDANITAFSLPNAMSDTIDAASHTVNVVLASGTDVTGLKPEITVSPGATISPESGVAQDFTNPVVYTVTAQDGTTVDWTVTVIVNSVNYVPIHDIQYTTDPSGDSPYKGKDVTTSGVVTAINVYKGVRKGYYLEDKAAAWNGVYVYDTDTTNHVAMGDSVEITGTVDEYKNLTEIKNLQDFNNLGSGYTRMPVEVTTGTYSDEPWESVLVKFVNSTCTNDALGHGEVEVNDGSGAGVLDDYLFPYGTTFVLNNVYTVTGIVNYYYSTWTLNPRDATDISDVTGISNNSLADNISVYPNPGNGRMSITLNNTLKGDVTLRIMDITGRVVYQRVYRNVMNQTFPVDISAQPSNLYFISISDAHNTVVKKFMKR